VSVVVVGTDATMVNDALRNEVVAALGDLDPAIALEDFSASESSDEPLWVRVLEALTTPPFLVERRVVVLRDAQSLGAEGSEKIAAWMKEGSPGIVFLCAVVGAKSHKLVKAASRVLDVNVGSGAKARAAFVESKFAEYGLVADGATLHLVTERVGDDVARVDSLARLLRTVYGSAPLQRQHVDPYLGEAGTVPPWDLTDALERGDSAAAITVARRMLDSRDRGALQIIFQVQRYVLNIARVQGSSWRTPEEVASALSLNPVAARKTLQMADRLGPERIADAVHLIAQADLDLKGALTYGSRDLTTDVDVTELTVIEVLVARLARLCAPRR
jgi:DNA polymerase-3 subunit delta